MYLFYLNCIKQSFFIKISLKCKKKNILFYLVASHFYILFNYFNVCIYSQVHKYWDIDTILTFLALYTTTMDFKWNKQDVL